MRNKTLAVFGGLLVALGVAYAAVPGQFSTVNALVGYQINGAAPSGQVICGNGTNGVYTASCPIAAQSAVTATSATTATFATTATNADSLAGTPTQCSGGTPMSQGIAANGNANCAPVPGVSGTLADVTGSRSLGSTFTNSGPTAIYVSGFVSTSSGGDTSVTVCTVNGIVVWDNQANATVSGSHTSFVCMVPASGTYSVTVSGTDSFALTKWTEFTF